MRRANEHVDRPGAVSVPSAQAVSSRPIRQPGGTSSSRKPTRSRVKTPAGSDETRLREMPLVGLPLLCARGEGDEARVTVLSHFGREIGPGLLKMDYA